MKILALSGSLRAASINSTLLRATARLAPADIHVSIFTGLGDLPLFNPDLEESPPANVVAFHQAVAESDALLFASPEYAHGVTGTIKNALDWLVGFEPFASKIVAVLNTSSRAHHADDALRETLKTMAAVVVESASITIPLLGAGLDESAMVATPSIARAVCNPIGLALISTAPEGQTVGTGRSGPQRPFQRTTRTVVEVALGLGAVVSQYWTSRHVACRLRPMRKKPVEARLKLRPLLAFVALCACAITPARFASAKQVAIVGVTVVNPEREAKDAAVADATVVISGDRIVAVGSRASTPVAADAIQIDGRGKWLIPGMIDGHVHFFQSGDLYTRPDVADFNAVMPYAREVARNKARLAATFKVWLASGVTGVIDVGGPFWNFDVRAAAERSDAAPRVATTGPLISMVARPQLELDDPPIIKVDSPAAARDLVRRELSRKPDFIKVWFIHRPGDDMAAQEAIVKATADAAHAAHVRLAVHATELDTAKAALHAGADYLVHSVSDAPVDDDFIRLARANHALLCPTLFVVNGYQYALSNRWQATPEEQRLADPQILATMHDLDHMPKDLIPQSVAKSMAEATPPPAPTVALENLKVLWDAGIPIVMGTDAGNIGTLHGPSVFREMALMHDAGLTPLQILRSATTNGARAMGRSDLGAIAPGKLADVVLLDADPLADVANLSRADRVIKAGVVYDPKALIDSIR